METSQLTSGGAILLGVSAVAGAAALFLAVMSPSHDRVARWSSHHGVALTETNLSVIAGYLRRTRSLQVAGALLGWLSSPVYIALVGRPFPLGDSWVMLAIAGYLLGAALAEVTYLKHPRLEPTVRAATLAPRSLSDYLPGASVWALRTLPAATVALAVGYAVASKAEGLVVDPSPGFMLTAAVLAVALAVLVEWFLRGIVARPQPAITSDLLAADDAIRSGSIHSLAAAGIALLLLSAGWAAVSLGGLVSAGSALSLGGVTASAPLGEVLAWLGVACDLAGLIVWIGLGHMTTWRVRRDTPLVSG